MALINCSECSQQVSDRAEQCPKCGNPIAGIRETIAAGTSVKTIQETGKKLKLHTLISLAIICAGVVMMIANNEGPEGRATPLLLIVLGFIWYFITRIRIWWHHK